MKQKSQRITIHPFWLIPFIFLLTFIVGTRLDMDGFWYDEVFTVRNAGGAGYGPLSPLEIYETIQADDPYQAIGYPFAIAAWGALVGWSEFALRVSSLLFTMIGLAFTYRLGRDVTASSATGILSAVIFAFSTFTVHYSHELRAFTFVTIFSAMTIWAYTRILKNPSRTAYLIFTIGGIGILYAHYYAAMLLIALGIYHLLFAPKNRAWFGVPLSALLMAIAFIPQLSAFFEGFTRFDPADVEKTPMSAYAVVESLLYYIGNGLILLTLAIMVIGLVLAFIQKNQLRIVVGIAFFGTLVLIVSNELLNILEPTRLRYAIFLWSLFSVWIATVLIFVSQSLAAMLNRPRLYPVLAMIIPGLWFANALIANTTPGFNISIEGTETPRMRTMTNILRAEGAAGDLFAFYNGTSQQAWYIQDTLSYSVWNIPMPTMTTASLYDELNASTRQWASEQIANTERVWYGANRTFGLNQVHDDFLALMDAEFVLCQTYVMNDDLSLELFARSQVYCNSDEAIAQFGGFTLHDATLATAEQTLSLQMGWQLDETIPPETYSLSVQILDADSQVVLSQDTGFPYDRFVPLQVDIDISELSAGDYQVVLLVYAWQTGERLQTETGDFYEIGQFQK